MRETASYIKNELKNLKRLHETLISKQRFCEAYSDQWYDQQIAIDNCADEIENRTLILIEMYVDKIPNVEKFFYDYRTGVITVFFDNIHTQEFKLSQII